MKPENLILDVDGTLWDSTEVVAGSWSRAIHDCGIEGVTVTAELLKKLFGKTMKVIAEALLLDCTEEKREEVMEVCCRYEHEDLEAASPEMLSPYPGVAETIRELSRERNLYIVSNCQCGYIELFLRKTGLADCITDTECFGNTGQQKGENIRLVMERNGVERAVYVGDTMGDYEAAKQAGIPFVFASYGFGEVPEGVPAIGSFPELGETE